MNDEAEPKVCSVHYRRINPICAYCSEPATILRITLASSGGPMVSTLCEKDARGEQEETTAGMQNEPGTGDYYNLEVIGELGEKIAVAVESKKEAT